MPSIIEYSRCRARPVKRPAGQTGGMPLLRALLLICAAGLAAPGAQAQQDLTGQNGPNGAAPPAALQAGSLHQLVAPQLVGRLVQRAGHRLRESAPARLLVDAGGLVYGIDFYQCVAADAAPGGPPATVCGSMRFSTAFDMPGGMTPAQANAWNRDRRFSRLWLDDDRDPNLEMDVSLAGGVTTAHLTDVLDWWILVLGDFLDHLGDLQAAAPGAGPQ